MPVILQQSWGPVFLVNNHKQRFLAVGRLSRSQLSKDQVQVYIREECNKRKHLLEKYIRLCNESKVLVANRDFLFHFGVLSYAFYCTNSSNLSLFVFMFHSLNHFHVSLLYIQSVDYCFYRPCVILLDCGTSKLTLVILFLLHDTF